MNKPFYIHQNLNNFDQFCENVRNWDLDYKQIDCGIFCSELLMFGNNETLFTHATLGRRMIQNGASPEGLITFGVLANPDINISWRNIEISGDMFFVFPESGELHSISNADFDVFVVSLSEEKLNQACSSFDLPDIRTLINNGEAFRCHPQKLTELRNWLSSVNHELTCNNTADNKSRYLKYIEQEMSYKIIGLLAERLVTASRKPSRKRDLALSAAEDYIKNCTAGVITLPELCAVANVSERTLEYAFRERYGVTPKNYTLVHRMNIVRKQLHKADAKTNSVSEIARQQNFWHMSQFSANYYKLFGELPSDALKRNY